MKTTSLVVTILVIVGGIYDAIAVCYGVLTDQDVNFSISSYMVQIGFDYPMIVFMVAYVCGHLFGYMRLKKEGT